MFRRLRFEISSNGFILHADANVLRSINLMVVTKKKYILIWRDRHFLSVPLSLSFFFFPFPIISFQHFSEKRYFLI